VGGLRRGKGPNGHRAAGPEEIEQSRTMRDRVLRFDSSFFCLLLAQSITSKAARRENVSLGRTGPLDIGGPRSVGRQRSIPTLSEGVPRQAEVLGAPRPSEEAAARSAAAKPRSFKDRLDCRPWLPTTSTIAIPRGPDLELGPWSSRGSLAGSLEKAGRFLLSRALRTLFADWAGALYRFASEKRGGG